jgi:hypothetical protein
MLSLEYVLGAQDFGDLFQFVRLTDEHRTPYTSYVHDGKLYYAIPENAQFYIQYAMKTQEDVRVCFLIDGVPLGGGKIIGKGSERIFEMRGFPVWAGDNAYELRAFTTKRARNADDSNNNVNNPHLGSVTLIAYPVTVSDADYIHVPPMSLTEQVTAPPVPDAKFFAVPSVSTAPGNVVDKQRLSNKKSTPKGPMCAKETVYYETPENLELRIQESTSKRAKN